MLRTDWLKTFSLRIADRRSLRTGMRRRRKLNRQHPVLEALETRVLLTSPPTTNDDSYSTDEDTELNVSAPAVLSNDTDPDSDPLTAVLDMPPANGTLQLNSDGSFDYTPNTGFTGDDSFSYHANDGMFDGNTATVTITVSAASGAPTAVADSYTIEWDTQTIAAPGVLGNDTDPDSDPLTAVLDTDVSGGTLTLNSDGSFTYTRDGGFSGTDSFTYHANDGTNDSDTVTVTLTVIDPFGTPSNLSDLPLGQTTSYGPVQASIQTGDAQTVHGVGGGHALVYRSLTTANPIVNYETTFHEDATIPATVEATLTVNNVAGSALHYDGGPLTDNALVRFAAQYDASSLSTGRYDSEFELKSKSGSDTATVTFDGSVDIVNWNDSAYGDNWNISGISRLFEQNDGVLLAHSNGASSWFADAGGGNFTSPVGPLSSSTLVKNGDSTFTLTSKYGNREEYNSSGIPTSRVDLNGNTVAYAYVDADTDGDTDDISTITGVYGRVTTFAYTSGLLSSVTDHASRVTTITHDANGRLATITAPDPDGAGPLAAPVTTYAYNSDGLLDSVTDPLSRVTETRYDHGNRLDGVTDAKDNFHKLDPVQSEGLVDTTGGVGSPGNLASLTILNVPVSATLTDPLGNDDEFEIDRFGNVLKHTNALGFVITYERDADGRVTKETQPDPDGNGPLTSPVTSFTYDSDGNLTQVTLPDSNTQSFVYDATLNLPTSTTDELGRATTFAYDANGNMTSVTDALSNVTTYAYDSNGRVTSVTLPDPDGAGPKAAPVTSFTYDSLGRLTQITNPDSTTSSATYNSFDQLVTATDTIGRVTTFTYDDLNRQLTVTLPDPDDAGPKSAPVLSTTYDAAGRVTKTTNPAGDDTSYTYNDINNLLTVTLPDPDDAGPQSSPVISYGYDANGRRTSQTDALGNVTTWGYNGAGWLVSSLTFPDPDFIGPLQSPQISFTYDNMGRRITVTDPLGNDTDTEYDSRSRVTKVTNALGNSVSSTYDAVSNQLTVSDPLGNVTTWAYDNLNRVTSITQPDPDDMGPLTSPVTSFAHDNMSRRTSVTDPVGSVTSTDYDIMSRVASVTDSLSNVTTFAYDNAGRRTSVTDPLSNVTSTAYDNLNRITSTTDAESGVTSFDYDMLGNLVSLTDPVSNTTSWTYDKLGRMTQETNALNDSRSFEYNANGQITKRTDRNSREIDYTYDNLSRLTKEEWLDTDDVTVIKTIDYTYDIASQLTATGDDVSDYAYTYDTVGQVTQVDNNGSVGPRVILDHTYNANGQRTQLDVSIDETDDLRNTWTYDDLGRVTSVQQEGQTGGNSVDWKRANIKYNARGQFDTITRKTATADVVLTTYGYDSNGRLTSLDHDDGASNELASYTWTWDSAHRITASTNDDGSSTYTYDDTSQLTGATHSYQTDETYTYDANGNRTMTGYSTGTNNQLLSDGTYNYEYDDEGNRTKKTEIATGDYVEYAWDHRNRLTDATFKDDQDTITKKVSYTYDVGNRRIEKKVDTDGDSDIDRSETFLYDSQIKGFGNLTDILLRYEDSDGDGPGSNAMASRYLHGPAVDQVFADEQASGGLYWLLADHQGTVRDIAEYDDIQMDTDVANHRTYTSFGELSSETAPAISTVFSYTGREGDDDVDLTYYRARTYDEATASFTSEDPLGFLAGDTNTTRYVGNSATTQTDPSGLFGESVLNAAEEAMGAVDDFFEEAAQGLIYIEHQVDAAIFGAADAVDDLAYEAAQGLIYIEHQVDAAIFGAADAVNAFLYEAALGLLYIEDLAAMGVEELVALHYERNINNFPPSTQSMAESEDYQWELQEEWESIYHQHGVGEDIQYKKYLSPDGHMEAVYDENGNLVTSPDNYGSYNYGSNPVTHILFDMIPYTLLGNSIDDPVAPLDRVIPEAVRQDIIDVMVEIFGQHAPPILPSL